MKRIIIGVCLLLATGSRAEDWKGQPAETNLGLSALAGAGIIGGDVGFNLVGTISYKILHDGFIPDITDQVHLEAQFGPMFINSITAFSYGLFLRWDFMKNETLTLYSLGGIGGTFKPDRVFPRVAVGTKVDTGPFALRFELSHEFIGAGVAFDFAI